MSDVSAPVAPVPSLRQEVDAFLKAQGLTRFGGKKLLVRVNALLALWAVVYGVYLYTGIHLWAVVGMAVVLGSVFAGLGFVVMHDASHCTLSRNQNINMFYYVISTHLLGMSRLIWTRQHVVAHHGHTNVLGVDHDLEAGGVLRLHPQRTWKPYFKWQHIYYPLGYALMGLNWVWYADSVSLFSFQYHLHGAKKIWALLDFVTTRMAHIGLYIVLPWVLMGPTAALFGYLVMMLVAGSLLAFVFQAAHVTPVQAFLTLEDEKGLGWEEHQLRTTANFGPGSFPLTLLVGGLNHQVEHHLFPHISHIHYAKIAPLVARLCAARGLPYHAYPTFGAALKAHHAFMVNMAQSGDNGVMG